MTTKILNIITLFEKHKTFILLLIFMQVKCGSVSEI